MNESSLYTCSNSSKSEERMHFIVRLPRALPRTMLVLIIIITVSDLRSVDNQRIPRGRLLEEHRTRELWSSNYCYTRYIYGVVLDCVQSGSVCIDYVLPFSTPSFADMHHYSSFCSSSLLSASLSVCTSDEELYN